MASDAELLRAFLQLFQWMYEVELSPAHVRQIEHELRLGWTNNDPSEHQLVAFVLDTYTSITSAASSDRPKLRQQAKTIFRKLFEKREQNDRGRVLATVHRCLESVRPGVTGLPLPGQQQPAMQPQGGAQFSNPRAQSSFSGNFAMGGGPSSYGGPGYSAGAFGGSPGPAPYGNTPPQSSPGGYPDPAPYGYQQPQGFPGGYPAPQFQGIHYASTPPFQVAPPKPYQKSTSEILAEAQATQESEMLKSTLQKMIHETNMHIIKNMGG